uniref:Uncharacterized protein n=1 Tax=Pristionchus pacificus TaxID=54126 RepID=A0A2A6BM79_PRIPA|eukprot:PDM66906.1 hypothetical protein PRIPAC_48323 [Pristionchus pacificus]
MDKYAANVCFSRDSCKPRPLRLFDSFTFQLILFSLFRVFYIFCLLYFPVLARLLVSIVN